MVRLCSTVLLIPVGVRPESQTHPEMGERLAGQTAPKTHHRRCDPAAELRASLEGQESLEEAESGGPVRGALQEA